MIYFVFVLKNKKRKGLYKWVDVKTKIYIKFNYKSTSV